MRESEIVEEINNLDAKLRNINKAYAIFPSDIDIPESLKKERFELEKGILKLRQELASLSTSTSEALPINEAEGGVFVIMPFKDPYNDYYENILKIAIREIGFSVARSDEIYSPTSFIQTIWRSIINAKMIVAEMTDMNPNVLYELGLCHAINKPVIMISQSIEHIPADLRHINSIIYNIKKSNWASTLSSGVQRMMLTVQQSIDRHTYLNPPASIDNAIVLEGIIRERDYGQKEIAKLTKEISAYKKSVSELIARKQEIELLNANILRNDESSEVYEFKDGDTGVAIYAYQANSSSIRIELVRVPSGPFVHGFGDSKEEIDLEEFYISRFSITNYQYVTFLNTVGNRREAGENWINLEGSSPADRCRIKHIGGMYVVEDGYEDHPVTYVNYYGANAFCQWAGGELPSEAQWEKAARGIDGRSYPWGNEPPTPDLVNCHETGWPRDVAPVEVYKLKNGVSPFGVVQAIGNVWHWTNTFYVERGVQAVRGGSFFDFRLGNRGVYRFLVQPDGPDFSQGFLFCKRFINVCNET